MGPRDSQGDVLDDVCVTPISVFGGPAEGGRRGRVGGLGTDEVPGKVLKFRRKEGQRGSFPVRLD